MPPESFRLLVFYLTRASGGGFGVGVLVFVEILRFTLCEWVTKWVSRMGGVAPFIRRVRTASGATAVQIVEKQGRKNVVLKHVGSAHNEVELTVLMQAAHDELHPGQTTLDLEPKRRHVT